MQKGAFSPLLGIDQKSKFVGIKLLTKINYMKTLTKHLSKIISLLVIVLLLANCGKENIIDDSQEQLEIVEEVNGISIENNSVHVDQVPGLRQYMTVLGRMTQNRATGSNLVVTPFGNIPLENITEVVDTLGNANYTFTIIPAIHRTNKFFNLVVHQAPDEEDFSSFVMEYDLDDTYAENYYNEVADLSEFTGIMRSYSPDEFLALTGSEGSRACGEDTGSTTDPCNEADVDNSDNGTAGSNGGYEDGSGEGDSDNGDPIGDEGPGDTDSSGGGGSDGASRPCWATLYIVNCGGTNSDVGHPLNSCQGPQNLPNEEIYFVNTCGTGGIQRTASRVNDIGCPIGGGAVAVSPVPFASLGMALGLSTEEESCLSLGNNCDLKNDIYDFLNTNILPDGSGWEQDALDFAGLVVDELVDDCQWDFEVDYEERIIYTDAILEYPCQVELIKQANSETGPLANLFQDIFNNSDRATIIYGAYDFGNLFEGAETPLPIDGRYYTSMNTRRLEHSTDLDIVKTTIHEMIHATLLYFWYNPYNDFGIGNVDPSYAELVDYFNEYRYFGNTNTSQHQYMALLVSDIANALETWADANGYANVPSSYFTKLAWGGLRDTDSFDYYYPEFIDGNINNPNPEWQEIEDAINAEIRLTSSDIENTIGTQASTIICN